MWIKFSKVINMVFKIKNLEFGIDVLSFFKNGCLFVKIFKER